jgi:tetratricopeptide (TPR) repeat protein
MNFSWAEWGPPLVVLALGLTGGTLYAVLSAPQRERERAERAHAEGAGARADLEQARDDSVQALRQLDLDQTKMTTGDYARERAALLARGAGALRELDRAQPAAGLPADALAALNLTPEQRVVFEALSAQATAAARRPPIGPVWVGALSTLAVVGLVALLFVLAGGVSVDRAPGGTMTGNQDLSSGQASPDAEKASLLARLEVEPDNLEVLDRLTILALSQEDTGHAMQYNQRALSIDPRDPDALTQRAVLSMMIGMTDRALETLDGVLAEHPDHVMALVYKGLISMEAGRPQDAIPVLERAIALDASNPAFLESQLAKARAMASGAVPTPGPTPIDGPIPAEAAPGVVVVEGRIDLAPGAAQRAVGAQALFVTVKDPRRPMPPLAALKLPPGPFPMAVEVTTADAIPMGGAVRAFPDLVDVSVRLDMDANAMTHTDTEPLVVLSGVAKGSTGLTLTLE